jgi:hypothetical protein
MDADSKLPYETPELIVHGTLESVTQAGGFVGGTDAVYPIHTQSSQGLFS